MRNKGSKNKHKTFYSDKRLIAKAEKLHAQIDNFIDASLSNNFFNPIIDFNKLHNCVDHLKEVVKLGKEN